MIATRLVVLLLLDAITSVLAWGDLGHRTVAYLAQHHLTDEAALMIADVLKNEKGYDISDGAVWADRIRRQHEDSAQWHFIDAQDNPPLKCGLEFKRDCNNGGKAGCVVSAITEMTSLFANRASRDYIGEKEALMFLLHFIGDVHQPLHTEKLDRGGNDIKVCFGGECGSLNLHSVWDTKLLIKYRGLAKSHSPAEEKQAAAAWAQELYTAQQSGDVASECTDIQTAQDCAVSWATEANAYVCSYVLSRGVDWLENNDLGAEYYDGAVPILDVLVGKAGRRLGQWLNNLAAARSTSMKVTQAEL